MKQIILLFLILSLGFNSSEAQELNAHEVIEKSIKFHDPTGNWNLFQETLSISQDNPKNEVRKRVVHLNRKDNSFSFTATYGTDKLEYYVVNGMGRALWNGSDNVADSIQSKYRISNERAVMYHNYYSYLYGMPMKLNDPGTVIHPKVESVKFHGNDYYKITVSYDESVGNDTWYFYFQQNNFALGAYEFWKNTPGDGEYLLLEGIKEVGQVKLPGIIKWYVTADDRWLGSDILE